MNNGEAYICLADYVPGQAKREHLGLPRSHSFTPLISTFAADQWRKISDGIYTHVRPMAEIPLAGPSFKIRLSAHPAIADDVLRKALPIIVQNGCHFKVIANSALLEFVCSKSSAAGVDGDFLIIYPRSQQVFNDLIVKLQRAVDRFKNANLSLPLPETSARKAPSPDAPWPGLDYFSPTDAAYFFGRKDEAQELALRLKQSVITVTLGQPGSGKTSLLCAGLKPLFEELRFEPVYLRLRFGRGVHPVQQIRDEVNSVLAERQIDGPPFAEGKTLWEYFRLQKSGWLGADRKPVVPVLIFDQFEDVFAFHGANLVVREEVEALWTQLAALVENRIPSTINQLDLPFPDVRRERESFKVIISLRQDFLQKLLARRGQMPSISQNHFLLQPMNGRKALEAVLAPGQPLLDPAKAETLANQIVRRLARETVQSADKPAGPGGAFEPLERLRVEPGLVSFFCAQVNEARKRFRDLDPEANFITATLVDSVAERIIEDFFQRTNTPRNPAHAASGEKHEKPARADAGDTILLRREPALPLQQRVSLLLGETVRNRPRYIVFALVMLALIILPVMVVRHFDRLQQEETDLELQAFVSHLATGKNTIESARNKLTLDQENIALQKSNLLHMAELARVREREAQDAIAQNIQLAGEKTNIQSRVVQLNHEKTQAESRLARYNSFLIDLTNKVASLNQQNQQLEARNAALTVSNTTLAVSNASLAVSNAALVVSNDAVVRNFNGGLLSGSNVAREIAATTPKPIDAPAPTPPPATLDELSPPGPLSVLTLHGQCLYSREEGTFYTLKPGHVPVAGVVIQTGKNSWVDLFIRATGATIRIAPESQLKIAKLSQTIQHGVAVTDTLLELRDGHIFAVGRTQAPENTLAVQDSTRVSRVECGGPGSCLITATPGVAAAKLTITPLGVVNPRGGINAAAREYHSKNVKTISLLPAAWEAALVQLDELESETDQAIALRDSPESATKN